MWVPPYAYKGCIFILQEKDLSSLDRFLVTCHQFVGLLTDLHRRSLSLKCTFSTNAWWLLYGQIRIQRWKGLQKIMRMNTLKRQIGE